MFTFDKYFTARQRIIFFAEKKTGNRDKLFTNASLAYKSVEIVVANVYHALVLTTGFCSEGKGKPHMKITSVNYPQSATSEFLQWSADELKVSCSSRKWLFKRLIIYWTCLARLSRWKNRSSKRLVNSSIWKFFSRRSGLGNGPHTHLSALAKANSDTFECNDAIAVLSTWQANEELNCQSFGDFLNLDNKSSRGVISIWTNVNPEFVWRPSATNQTGFTFSDISTFLTPIWAGDIFYPSKWAVSPSPWYSTFRESFLVLRVLLKPDWETAAVLPQSTSNFTHFFARQDLRGILVQ